MVMVLLFMLPGYQERLKSSLENEDTLPKGISNISRNVSTPVCLILNIIAPLHVFPFPTEFFNLFIAMVETCFFLQNGGMYAMFKKKLDFTNALLRLSVCFYFTFLVISFLSILD